MEERGEWKVRQNENNYSIHEIGKTDTCVINTHTTDLESLRSILQPTYGGKVFYITLDSCHSDTRCEGGNILCMQYEQVCYKTPEERRGVVDGVASAVIDYFPRLKKWNVIPDVDKAYKWLVEMDNRLMEISDPDDVSQKTLRIVDKKFGFRSIPKKYSENRWNITHYCPPSNRNKYLILQSSRQDTGSTLLANILIGLFEPIDTSYSYLIKKHGKWRVKSDSKYHLVEEIENMDIRVIKTHITDLVFLKSLFKPVYGDSIVFIRSDRCYSDPTCKIKDMMCVKYEDMLYETPEEMRGVIERISSAVTGKFPQLNMWNIIPDVDRAYKRQIEMDKRLHEMSNSNDTSKATFRNVDDKFGVHGNHKGQSKTWRKHTGYCNVQK